ncbi:SixA phosphatase family protein [Gillisia sp. CAL575]|uniref:SixA phosphatase family protein n=1 Tax=Gillisia sp. CAL575 TaxID=985255 RepID=UPI0003A20E8B|nr:histidine phosphatase family protein [Gillisia sp. CAL575]
MKNLFLILLTLLASCNFQKSESSDKHLLKQVEESKLHINNTTYYLIRHAEKDRSDASEKDPKLTETGIKRAEKWAEVLKEVPFDMVYSTNYNRTKSTAQPIAESHKLEIEIYDPNNLYDQEFQKTTKGKTVLIVGHSNTTPAFVNAIMRDEKYKDLPDDENSGLFIVTVSPNQTISTQLLFIN